MIKGGIGGANTNLSGLKFEDDTDLATRIARDLSDKYVVELVHIDQMVKRSTAPVYRITARETGELVGYIGKQNQFYNLLKNIYGIDNQNHKAWKPDESFFNIRDNTVYIVEKKCQNSGGSVDEKILGFDNKRRLYQKQFNSMEVEPKVDVSFCALFNSSWWIDGNNGRNEKYYEDSFDALRMDGIKMFFDDYRYSYFGL